ncbi:MAG: hypothetical protein IPP94_12000 [Ignavibacteria bacterium]|nr:hypothetical protein [Ignavibacteria bacterium]
MEPAATESGDVASSHPYIFPFLLLLLLLPACSGKVSTVEEFRATATEMEQCARDMRSLKKAARDMLQAYNQTVPAQRRLTAGSVKEAVTVCDHDKLLSQMRAEPDESCKSLLDKIEELDESYRARAERFEALAARLPDAHRVRRGENHYAICAAYLQQAHRLSRDSTVALLAGERLVPDLFEGFDVWLLYADGRFATFVTQGATGIAPETLTRVARAASAPAGASPAGDMQFDPSFDARNAAADVTGGGAGLVNQ